jgi:hypothetical protein
MMRPQTTAPLDIAMEIDREFFRLNPNEILMVRRVVPGEFDPTCPDAGFVMVGQIKEGFRFRLAVESFPSREEATELYAQATAAMRRYWSGH